ncbi:hypothetical protein [Glycomyces algeriensis]|uniref:Uncharacterized protein n=1 Tax=Glycomyces algeriensis TaxID=256037 RepID=A0A9W6LJI6_9ACTN|nr:hypothetical protein [Glycomyces algeriensis]MDA1367867.1 hypothetical protein [Glycomyces algeriensis]MDR7352014.1 hypothetical protein [Glycomyces algeriensis]GLI44746.1 hypothetical protein GALLR39Z86_45960 [Glycomyces algeriensis]
MEEEWIETTEVRIAVCETDWLGCVPLRMWGQDLALPTDEIQKLRPQLEELTYDGNAKVAHRIDIRGGRTSWGADSGEHLSIVLYITSSVGSAVIGAAVNELYSKLRDWQRQCRTRSEYWSPEFTAEEAVARAKWIIQSRFGNALEIQGLDDGSFESLRLVSERREADENKWTIRLVDSRGIEYLISFGFEGDIPICTTIERTLGVEGGK